MSELLCCNRRCEDCYINIVTSIASLIGCCIIFAFVIGSPIILIVGLIIGSHKSFEKSQDWIYMVICGSVFTFGEILLFAAMVCDNLDIKYYNESQNRTDNYVTNTLEDPQESRQESIVAVIVDEELPSNN
jgi:uncharacterized membrane protein